MELTYIDEFIYQIFITIHLLILMFGLVYGSGRLFSYFLNKLFEPYITEKEKKQKLKRK